MTSLQFSLLALLSLVVFSESSLAYFVAVPTRQAKLDYTKPTRILIPGRGGSHLALLPQVTATTRAVVYAQNFPDEQLVMISVIESKNNEGFLNRAGWTLIEKNDTILETNSLLSEIEKFSRIRSFEIFGHSSAIRGFQTDGDDDTSIRFDPREERVWKLKDRFMPGAYAILSGCNSGWSQAQLLAKKWNIAAMGSLTESQFERLAANGHFYVNDTKPAKVRWAGSNPQLGNIDCDFGGCVRMRPNTRAYHGWWGHFDGPLLTHFKVFCPLEEGDCQKAMAYSLYGFASEKPLRPDSTLEQFRQTAKEFLCPLSPGRQDALDCYKQLSLIEEGKGNRNVHYIDGNDEQLICDFKGCKAKISCDLSDEVHTCHVTDREWKGSTTLADEYMNYINGFKKLQAEGMPRQ